MTAPRTDRDDVVDHLHGTTIADPYRWLEDVDSPRTQSWVEAQRRHADQVLGALPERPFFEDVMSRVTHRPRASAPWVRSGVYLRSVHDGQQKQEVIQHADTLDELVHAPRVLVDPNAWTADGSASVRALTINPDGSWVAVARSDAGSDWTSIHVIDRAGSIVEDGVVVTKFHAPTWLPDGRTFIHNAYTDAGRTDGAESRALPTPRAMLHTVGTPVDGDRLLWDFTDSPRTMGHFEVSDDDAWLVAHVARGTENANRVWLFPLTTTEGRTEVGERVELVAEATAEWTYVGSLDGELLFLTDHEAPTGRVVALTPDGTLREVIGASAHPIAQVARHATGLLVETLQDAQPVLTRFDLSGQQLGPLDLAGGAVVRLSARPTSDEVFVGLSTLTEVEVGWLVDAATGQAVPVSAPDAGWQAPKYRVERHHATSADGTRVPYFLVVPEGVAVETPRPVMLYGYGGFAISVQLSYRAIWPGWLAAGGVIAIANLRGGGEFGRDWYEQGRRQHKQHVFDDVIAVAEHLVASGTTTPAQLAIHGKSNGGLLVGAAITQRPDLFAVALPHVGVLDALRFHKFTIGAAWISDYGDPDDPEDFTRALSWSPLHRVVEGTSYPATLVLTGDHDDRVVPAHSHKFTATLQHAHAGDAPIVTRIEASTGHGLDDKPPAVLAAEGADLLAFAAHHTGLTPPAGA